MIKIWGLIYKELCGFHTKTMQMLKSRKIHTCFVHSNQCGTECTFLSTSLLPHHTLKEYANLYINRVGFPSLHDQKQAMSRKDRQRNIIDCELETLVMTPRHKKIIFGALSTAIHNEWKISYILYKMQSVAILVTQVKDLLWRL